MPEPYVGEIKMFAGNFAPLGWMFCAGQQLSISEYDTLYSLIGTTYGGDGVNTFQLPDLQGRVPVHQGTASTGTRYILGQKQGAEQITLTTQQLPVHNHAVTAAVDNGTQASPGGSILAGSQAVAMYNANAPNQTLYAGTIQPAGGSQPHENFQPYLCVSFIIALSGIYPTQG